MSGGYHKTGVSVFLAGFLLMSLNVPLSAQLQQGFPLRPLDPAVIYLAEGLRTLGVERKTMIHLGAGKRADDFCNQWVLDALQEPLVLPERACDEANGLGNARIGSFPLLLGRSRNFLGASATASEYPDIWNSAGVNGLLRAAFGNDAPPAHLAALPQELESVLFRILRVAIMARLMVKDATKTIPAREFAGALRACKDRLAGRGAPSGGDTARFLAVLKKMDRERLFGAASLVLKEMEYLATNPWKKSHALPKKIKHFAGYEGDVRLVLPTAYGDIVVGGPGQTVYRKDAFVVLDLGGDDLYFSSSGGASASQKLALLIDFGGDDFYRSTGSVSQGSGVGGIGCLLDLGQGKDIFLGADYSQGVGLAGVGLLLDDGGKNLFRAGRASQGAGALGIGFLLLGPGGDSVNGKAPCQGMAGPGGVGILLDQGGNDWYAVAGVGTQIFPRVSQGGAAGWSEVWVSGGTGILLDLAGDDIYEAEGEAQGVGFFRGGGLLLDLSGRDRYRAGRWAQGAGSSQGVGLLLDAGGGDTYIATGSAQGVGHDRGLGFLVECGGEDYYRSGGPSQGAATWHGCGICIDIRGDDWWQGKPMADAGLQGWGAALDGWGSAALLIDCGGKDFFSTELKNGDRRLQGKSGVAIDSGGESESLIQKPRVATVPPKKPAEVKPVAATAGNIRAYFEKALLLEPGCGEWQSALAVLVGMGCPALDWVASRVLVFPTAAGISILEELTRGIGAAACPIIRKGLLHSQVAGRAISARLCGLLSDQEAVESLDQLLADDPSPLVRRAAAEALGMIGLKNLPTSLRDLARSPDIDDRISAAKALAGCEDPRVLDHLFQLALDPFWGVREVAMGPFTSYGKKATERLEALLQKKKDKKLVRVVNLLGHLGQVSSAPLLVPLLEDPDPLIRAAVVEALGRIGEPSSLERTRQILVAEPRSIVRAALKKWVEKRDGKGK